MTHFTQSRSLSFALLLGVLWVALLATSPSRAQVQFSENVVLAYPRSNNSVNVRWTPASNLHNWQSGAFTNPFLPGKGVGLIIDEFGALHAVISDTSRSIRSVLSMGPASWSNSFQTVPVSPPKTSPVGVSTGNNRWAVAYTQEGSTVFVGIVDSGQLIANVGPFDNLNKDVVGRPSIAISGDTVVAAWRRNTGTLIVAKGTVKDQTLSFTLVSSLPTAAGTGLTAGVVSDPVVARAGSDFYVAVVRTQQGGGAGTLHGWRTQLFKSEDQGSTWSSVSITGALAVDNGTHLGLAGTSHGTLLCVALNGIWDRQNNRPSGRASPSAASFSNGAWTSFSSAEINAMFNHVPTHQPFAILSSKE